MTRDITAVTEDDTIKTVARILVKHKLSGVPVVNENNKILGFISEKDVLQSEFPQEGELEKYVMNENYSHLAETLAPAGEKKVKDFMCSTPICVSGDTSIIEVVQIFLKYGFKVLPVEKENILIGVIGRAELCKSLLEDKIFE
jgi:CBS domain-containing protein